METLDTLVVGAGQAGLGISYFLQQAGRNHIVLERGRIGESWLSQRWDSFTLNTLNFMNSLPGLPYDGHEPDGFSQRDALISYFLRYVERFQLPVRSGVAVTKIEHTREGEKFLVTTRSAGGVEEFYSANSVVVASGSQNQPKFPPIQSKTPAELLQLHTASFRNEASLPDGAVVIVGSGQSGCQIAEDLLSSGRNVYLCTSKVGRVPRRYRGRDILEWWIDTGFLDVSLASLPNKSISRNPQPQVSGLGCHGHSVSLQSLKRQGAVILGHLLDVEAGEFILSDEAAANVQFADAFSQKMKDDIDGWLKRSGVDLPPEELDPADVPDSAASCVSPIRKLDPVKANVSTVIWSTGFQVNFNWIHLPVLDAVGYPVHTQRISIIRGLYFLGFPWLSSRKSGLIYGIEQDAARIAGAIGVQFSKI